MLSETLPRGCLSFSAGLLKLCLTCCSRFANKLPRIKYSAAPARLLLFIDNKGGFPEQLARPRRGEPEIALTFSGEDLPPSLRRCTEDGCCMLELDYPRGRRVANSDFPDEAWGTDLSRPNLTFSLCHSLSLSRSNIDIHHRWESSGVRGSSDTGWRIRSLVLALATSAHWIPKQRTALSCSVIIQGYRPFSNTPFSQSECWIHITTPTTIITVGHMSTHVHDQTTGKANR